MLAKHENAGIIKAFVAQRINNLHQEEYNNAAMRYCNQRADDNNFYHLFYMWKPDEARLQIVGRRNSGNSLLPQRLERTPA